MPNAGFEVRHSSCVTTGRLLQAARDVGQQQKQNAAVGTAKPGSGGVRWNGTVQTTHGGE